MTLRNERWERKVTEDMTRRSEAEGVLTRIRGYFHYLHYTLEPDGTVDRDVKEATELDLLKKIEKDVEGYCEKFPIEHPAGCLEIEALAEGLERMCYRELKEHLPYDGTGVEAELETRDGRYMAHVEMDRDGILVRMLDEDDRNNERLAEQVAGKIRPFEQLLAEAEQEKREEWIDCREMRLQQAEMDRMFL